MIGQVLLGKYVVVAPLGEGGMSRLYLARQSLSGREVVIKLLKKELLARRDTIEHFRREIHITTWFHHAHAVAAVDSAQNGPLGPVLVMEYLRGVDLHELICRKGRFPLKRVGLLLTQLCDVLQAAHNSGIIHRDLKPGNCMILSPGSARETLKLMDFGLAQMQSVLYIAPEEVDAPYLPAAAGTPEYICPELVRGQPMDQRGDIYSVGVILFELLTGRRPFAAAAPDELMQAHLHQPPPRFGDLGLAHELSPTVEALVQSCLAKNPEDRPPGALEVALRFQRAIGEPVLLQQTPPTPGSGLSSRPTPAPTIADRHAFRHSIEAVMPEAMALVKIKGFIHDLGGSVIDSVPGLIRVRLPDPSSIPEKPGAYRACWDPGSKPPPATQVIGATDMELHMEREDPGQPNRLTVTLLMRPAPRGPTTPAWRSRCNRIGRELQAYLMGR